MKICGEEKYKETRRIINDAKNNHQLVIFVGAGASADAGIPLWKEAIVQIKDKMILCKDEQPDYLLIPQYYCNSRGKKEYTQLMRLIFRYQEKLKPTDVHKSIVGFNVNTIITTNYDHLLELAYENNGEFVQVISQDADLPYKRTPKEIVKMHGDFEHDNFVLKEDDYLNYSSNFKLIETYVKSLIGSKVVLCVGYSLNDPDVKHIISWVKDALNEDFQRLYLVLTKKDPNDIEVDYYRNLGVNIIYASEFDSGDCLSHSEQLVKVLDYLKKPERMNEFEELYEKMQKLDELNYVFGKYIFNAFYKCGIVCGDEGVINLDCSNRNANDDFDKAFWNAVHGEKYSDTFAKEKMEKIISSCKKSRFTELIFHDGSSMKSFSFGTYEKSILSKMIFTFDYEGLKKLYEDNMSHMSSEKPEIYMQQASICSFLGEYFKAFNFLKNASKAFYDNRQYQWYFIAEFNRKYIGKIALSSPCVLKIETDEKEELEEEVKAIDLDRVLASIPKGGEFLNELKSFTIAYNLFYDVYSDSVKSVEQAKTEYSLFAGTAAYQRLRYKISDYDRFETENFIMLDKYMESKKIYELYIRTIIASINAVPINHDIDAGMSLSNIKADELTDFDIYIMLRYLNAKEIALLFKENKVKHLPLSDSAKEYIDKICETICSTKDLNSPIYIDRFWTFLNYISHTSMSEHTARVILARLIVIKNSADILAHNGEINSFVVKLCDQKSLQSDAIFALSYQFLISLFEMMKMEMSIAINVSTLSANLLFFFAKSGRKFSEEELLGPFISDKHLLLLSQWYPNLAEVLQKTVSEKIALWTPLQNAEQYFLYCIAVLSEMIEPSREMETQIFEWIEAENQKTIQKDVNVVVFPNPRNYHDVISAFSNLHLQKKIFDLPRFVSVADKCGDLFTKWIVDMENFDYNLFDLKWLLICPAGILKDIASNEKVREGIINEYKLEFSGIDNEINDIIVKYFL